ncbi:MAG: hypothetical protein HY429_02040 [Candidatus Levybacteria bacterium]|nr:hypothetical protein [Candidatus Levybacteria bacterium]
MFGAKKSVIVISKTHIKAIIVKTGARPKEVRSITYAWSRENIINVLQAVKKITGKTVRILLHDDLVYETSIAVPLQSKLERDDIQRLAQEQIPENLNQTAWDYKEMLILPVKQEKMLQIVAVINRFYQQLNAVFAKLSFTVESAEPLSYAIARLLEHDKRPLLVLHTSDTMLLLSVYKGLVVATQAQNMTFSQTDIAKFLQFLKSRFAIAPKKIVVSATGQMAPSVQFNKIGLALEVRQLSGAVSTSLKQDIVGEDSQTLNLAAFFNQQATQISSPRKRNMPLLTFILVLIIGISLFIAALALRLFLK